MISFLSRLAVILSTEDKDWRKNTVWLLDGARYHTSAETRKIMKLPDLRFSATCVRVPVLRAHSEAVNIEFEQPFPVDEARQLLAAAPGVELIEDQAANRFPMPTDVTGRDPVAIGRIRQDISDPNALEL